MSAMPLDLAVLMVGVAGRQATSPTAMAEGRTPPARDITLMAPPHGAFNLATATSIARWNDQ